MYVFLMSAASPWSRRRRSRKPFHPCAHVRAHRLAVWLSVGPLCVSSSPPLLPPPRCPPLPCVLPLTRLTLSASRSSPLPIHSSPRTTAQQRARRDPQPSRSHGFPAACAATLRRSHRIKSQTSSDTRKHNKRARQRTQTALPASALAAGLSCRTRFSHSSRSARVLSLLCRLLMLAVGQSATITSPTAAAAPNLHSRPMKLAAGPGSRTRHYKGTFGSYPHETYGPPALGQDKWGRTVPLPVAQQERARTAPSKRREVDLRGAPANLHRGVTSLRARTLATGTVGSCVPPGNLRMSLDKELEWHPCACTNGSLMVHEHPRNMFEGLAGVKAKAGKIHAAHAHEPFSTGAHHSHHALFDPTVRGISADHTYDPYSSLGADHPVAAGRIKHRVPFINGGGAPKGVGADKSFLGGHAQFPYHYSEYSLSEKSLSETSTNASTGPGFRVQCAHLMHFPMRSTTARPSKIGGETNRDSNFHAIQAQDERCEHRCNEVLAAARSQGATATLSNGQPPNPNNVASNGAPVRFTARF